MYSFFVEIIFGIMVSTGTFSHGVTQIIIGALDNNPSVPPGSWTELASLATGNSVNTAIRNDAVVDTLMSAGGTTNALLQAGNGVDLVKGAAGYATGIGVQQALNGGDYSSIDWADVAISTAVGAIAPGLLTSAGKAYKS